MTSGSASYHLDPRGLLDGTGFVDLETLYRKLDASEPSVRRDLVQLESESAGSRLWRCHASARSQRPRTDTGTMIHLAPLETADYVVSDAGLAEEYRDMLRGHGVEVLLG